MRRYVIEASETRIKACLNISSTGMISPVVGELEDLRLIEPDKAIQVCERHRDVIVGVKARLTDFLAGENALPAVRNARVVADAVGLPIMIHPNAPVCTLDEILAEMKAGDLLTHCFHGMDEGILDADGRVRQSVRAAADRGVNLDVGHGQGSFSWTVAESAIAQDLLPATISSDLHAYNVDGPVYDLATTLGKFLQLGMDLDDALRRCTVTPAEILGMVGQIGTLRPGAFADVALFREEVGQHVFEDAHGETRIGERRLVPVKVVKGGRVIDAVARAANHHH
jgi:dihydroorotase